MHGSVYKCHYRLFLFAALLASFELMVSGMHLHASPPLAGLVSWLMGLRTVVFYGALLAWHLLWRFASHDRGADISSVYMAKTYVCPNFSGHMY